MWTLAPRSGTVLTVPVLSPIQANDYGCGVNGHTEPEMPTKTKQIPPTPRFAVGQLVHHKLFGYRGVVVGIDHTFEGTETWYVRMAKTKPPRNQPWYHVLVHDASHQTYVAERNLQQDDTGDPIEHPFVSIYFDDLVDGHYVLTRPLN